MRVGWAAFSLFSLCVSGCDSAESPASGPPSSDTPGVSSASALAPALSPDAPAGSASADWVIPVFTPAPPLSARRAAALAADLTERERVLRSSFTPPLRIVRAGEAFLVCAGDPGAPVDAVVSLIETTTHALYDAGRFQHKSDGGTTVWVYRTQAAFARGIAAHTTARRQAHSQDPADPKPPPTTGAFGLFDPESRTVLLRTEGGGLGSANHEILHPLSAGLGGDFPRAPPALLEGLPSAFEVVDWANPMEPRFGAHFRLQSLRDAQKSSDPEIRDSLRLDKLFAMGDDFNYGPRYLHFALAREALRFIAAKGPRVVGAPNALWRFWATCRDNVLQDETCAKSFEKVMERSPEKATPDFLAWVNSREAEGEVP